jgi:hypothetical protein
MKKVTTKLEITFATDLIFSCNAVHLTIAFILAWNANTRFTKETFTVAPCANTNRRGFFH